MARIGTRHDADRHLARLLTDWTLTLVRMRWLVGAALLVVGMAGPGGIHGLRRPDGVFLLGLVVLAYNLIFFFAIRRRGPEEPILFGRHRRFAFWQVTLDWLALTVLIVLTGGPVNPLAIVFIFHVSVAAIYLPPRDCLRSGTLATVVLVAATAAEYAGFVLPRSSVWGDLAASPGLARTLAFLGTLIACYSLTALSIQKLGDRLWVERKILVEATKGLERWRDRARSLNQMSLSITQAREVKAIFRMTVEAATKVCEAPAAALRVYDEESGSLDLVASAGLSDAYLRKGSVRLADSLVDQRVQAGEMVAIVDLREDPLFQYQDAAKDEGITSVLCAPLTSEGRFLGVLRAYDKKPRNFGPTAREFMAGLAGLASIALTNARAYVELESRDRTTRDFVIGGTHALRSPLAAVQNMLDLLLEGYAGDITPQQRELLVRARQKNERQLDLVRELLYLTTRDIDSARAAPKRVDLAGILRAEVEKVRESAAEAHLRLEIRVDGEPCEVRGNAEELGLLTANLLQNAIKYTPAGGSVSAVLGPDLRGFELKIEDTGIGIPVEAQSHIFQAFYRAPNAKDLSAVGTGLGLTLVKRIAERMEGHVAFTSEAGKGTCFRVWFPGARE